MIEQKIIELAKSKGLDEIVVNHTTSNSISIKYENKSFTKNNQSFQDSFNITAFVSGNKITKYIARPTEGEINKLLDEIIEEAKFKTKEIDEHPLDTSLFKYEKPLEVNFKPPKTSDVKGFLIKLVDSINKLDPRIKKENTFAMYSTGFSSKSFISTTGTNLSSNPSNSFSIIAYVIFDGGKGDKGTSYSGFSYTHENQIKLEEFLDEIKKDIKLQENKKQIPSDNYEIVFDRGAFIDLFSKFFMHINGRSVIDNLTKWKVGNKVASSKINLIDTPYIKDLGISILYDADGFPTKKQYFIKEGKLEKYLTNKKISDLIKTENTGNSNGSGASFYFPLIETGKTSEKEIFKSVENGILVHSFSGMHSGINPISGEFSIEVKGNIIKDGKVIDELKDGVISGNFFNDILLNIEFVGNKINLRKFERSPLIKLSKKMPISTSYKSNNEKA